MRVKPVNPIAKTMAHSRRRTSTQVVPSKKLYNRKKDKTDATKAKQNNDQ